MFDKQLFLIWEAVNWNAEILDNKKNMLWSFLEIKFESIGQILFLYFLKNLSYNIFLFKLFDYGKTFLYSVFVQIIYKWNKLMYKQINNKTK